MDHTIVYWNRAAERILGYTSDEVLGRNCDETLFDVAVEEKPGDWHPGCPSIRALQAGRLPTQTEMRMVSASGERRLVSLTPIIIGATDSAPPLIVHLITDAEPAERPEPVGRVVPGESSDGNVGVEPDESATLEREARSPRLTKRELEVLRLVSRGWETRRIASELDISPHTVLNHIRHFRRKLGAPTKLDAVVTAIRLGMLPID